MTFMYRKMVFVDLCQVVYTLGHHQDYYIFSRGSQTKPSFATVPGRGDNPIYTIYTIKTPGQKCLLNTSTVGRLRCGNVVYPISGTMEPPLGRVGK